MRDLLRSISSSITAAPLAVGLTAVPAHSSELTAAAPTTPKRLPGERLKVLQPGVTARTEAESVSRRPESGIIRLSKEISFSEQSEEAARGPVTARALHFRTANLATGYRLHPVTTFVEMNVEDLPFHQERRVELAEISRRIGELREEAADESMPWNAASERELIAFCASVGGERPAIYLLENGNLRAVWRDRSGAQIGLQFRGDGQVHYVIFAPRGVGPVARHYGQEHVANIRAQVRFAGLERLLNA